MRYKKIVAATLIAGSFLLGIASSEPIKDVRKYFHYETAKGFYEKPYNLKIETRKNIEGKIETYLIDGETKQHQKIGPNMYVGDYKHRLKSAINIPKEVAEKHKPFKFLLELYGLISDDE